MTENAPNIRFVSFFFALSLPCEGLGEGLEQRRKKKGFVVCGENLQRTKSREQPGAGKGKERKKEQDGTGQMFEVGGFENMIA